MGTTLLRMQPSLLHVPVQKDVVYTPVWLAHDMINHFAPSGNILDPCAGDGAFFDMLPQGSQWCEIARGRDFFRRTAPADWIIGNPPYSCLLSWIRHSLTIAPNIVYLMPLHRVFASAEFLNDLRRWGGVRQIRLYGTGADAGFPFGHALAAVHYQQGEEIETLWSSYR